MVGQTFGFNDTFAIEIRGEDARRFGLKTISQAAAYTPQWRAGFGYEFMERPDGYKGLAAAYGLRFAESPRIMDLGLLARALKDKQVDLAAGNTTDELIPALDLFVLEDDRHYFPPNEAVPIIRPEMLARHPEAEKRWTNLRGQISDERHAPAELRGGRRASGHEGSGKGISCASGVCSRHPFDFAQGGLCRLSRGHPALGGGRDARRTAAGTAALHTSAKARRHPRSPGSGEFFARRFCQHFRSSLFSFSRLAAFKTKW